MDLMIAARGLVRRFRGGIAAMALLLGKSAGVLQNELSGKHAFAKLGLLDAVAMTDESGDLAILEAWATHARQMLLPLPNLDLDPGHPVLESLGKASAEFADVCRVVCEALADGRVSDNELAKVTREAGELIAAINLMYGRLVTENRLSKPAHAQD